MGTIQRFDAVTGSPRARRCRDRSVARRRGAGGRRSRALRGAGAHARSTTRSSAWRRPAIGCCSSDAPGPSGCSRTTVCPVPRTRPLSFSTWLLPPEPALAAAWAVSARRLHPRLEQQQGSPLGGGLESEFIPYAQGGYAVLAYDARAWGDSCGADQQANAECAGQWNHLADVRYEVRDTQYLAGLLADELLRHRRSARRRAARLSA